MALRINRSRLEFALAAAFLILTISGCNSGDSAAPAPITVAPICTTQDGTYFTLSGTATYDWVPAANASEGGIGLNYNYQEVRPIRRAIARAVNAQGAILSETRTDDNGNYLLNVPGGCGAAHVVVLAKSKAAGYSRDGIAQDNCAGASWDIRITDNTRSKANYAIQSTPTYLATTNGISTHAATQHTNGAYLDRAGAPFAILDTLISELELICQANPMQYFPLLYVNWSPNNVTNSGKLEAGQIGTSFFMTDEAGVSNIYVLGEEDVDTDEYDDHVIAHEFGHYLEFSIFRSDSIGGNHVLADVLDPRVAFSEGYASALAAMTFEDPIYVDTNNTGQKKGFALDVSTAPVGNDRGLYSETSVQHLLWSLYESRKLTTQSGFDRIYSILKNHQTLSPGFTTLHSFAAYYNQQFGATAENLSTLWETALRMPLDALCAGSCTGSGDTADLWDSDNDLGNYFASALGQRRYDGRTWNADFWRMYRPLSAGLNAATGHEVTDWSSYSYFENKFGNSRWYRYLAPSSGRKTFTIGNLVGAVCSLDVLDIFVYRNGVLLAANEDYTGCPSVEITAMANENYIIEVRGQAGRELSSWTVTLSP